MIIEMINVQSLADVVIELVKGIPNIFSGDNESGKSVFFKIFKFLIVGSQSLGNEYGEDLIRENCDMACLRLKEDGNMLEFLVFKTYQIYRWNGVEYKQRTCPQEVIDFFEVYGRNGITPNILDRSLINFMLESDEKNGKVLYDIISSEILDALASRYPSDLAVIKERKRDVAEQLAIATVMYDSVKYVDTTLLENCVSKIEDQLKVHMVISELVTNVVSFRDDYKEINQLPDFTETIVKWIEVNKFVKIIEEFKRSYVHSVLPKIDMSKYDEMRSLVKELLDFRKRHVFGLKVIEEQLELERIDLGICYYCGEPLRETRLHDCEEVAIEKIN